jgi:pilus assembly protein CpaB
MKMRGIILLLLSLLSGIIAVAWLHNLNTAATPEAEAGTSIVVAGKNLDYGDHVSPADLRVVKWPAGTVPAGSFTKIEDLAGPGEDRVVLRPMEANEPVLATKVSGNGGKSSLSSVIEADKRAMTIHVNDATGVAGFVQPGDHVDILLTHADLARTDGSPGASSPMSSAKIEVLLQDVLVRAIDQEINVRKDAASTIKAVTVEVSPRDAQKLTLASSIGTLSLTLRNMRSKQQVAPSSLSVKDLLPPGVPPVIAEKLQTLAAPKEPSYDIVRGTAATTYEVPREHGDAPASRVMGVAPTSGARPN